MSIGHDHYKTMDYALSNGKFQFDKKALVTGGALVRSVLVLVRWVALLTLLTACSTTTEPKDSKERPRVGVIGHGTTPGSSWAGVGITVPFPGKQSTASPTPPSGQDPKEAGK